LLQVLPSYTNVSFRFFSLTAALTGAWRDDGVAVRVPSVRHPVHVRSGLDHHGHPGDALQRAHSPATHTHLQFELSHFTKAGSLCLIGGMLALLVGERMLRDFATSTVFESGAGVVAMLLQLYLSLICFCNRFSVMCLCVTLLQDCSPFSSVLSSVPSFSPR
jgi:hypothetical protein